MATAESISIQGLNFVCVGFFAFPGLANWLYFIFSHDLLQTVLHALYKSYALFRSSAASVTLILKNPLPRTLSSWAPNWTA